MSSRTAPHDTAALAHEILSEAVTRSWSDVRADISKLPAEDLREFFLNLREERLRLAAVGRTDMIDYRIRLHLGVWYATTFLACVPLQASGLLALDERLRALAMECLQWHARAFLSHVLVYYRYPGNEQMELCTALVPPECQTCQGCGGDSRWCEYMQRGRFNGFLQNLQSYVLKYGSTVRGDYYLEYRKGDDTNSVEPVYPPRVFSKGFCQYGTILLPPEEDKMGDEDLYLQCVRESFQDCYAPTSEKHNLLHIAAGSDIHYRHAEKNRGAVAHMYVVSTSQMKPSTEYFRAMREALHHLAMTYALEKLDKAATEIREAATREHTFGEELRERFVQLTGQLMNVEETTRSVRRFLAKTSWHAIEQFVPTLMGFTTTDARLTVISKPVIGNHDTWQDWEPAAKLVLANVKQSDAFFKEQDFSTIWSSARQQFTQLDYDNDPLLRCLGRLAFLTATTPSWWTLDILKSAFLPKRPFANNEVSLLWLLCCVGASCSTKQWEERVRLNDGVRLEVVTNGLNRFLESLLRYNKQPLNSPLDINVTLTPTEMALRLSPVILNHQAVTLAGVGFTQIFTLAAGKIRQDRYPGMQQDETTMCMLYSLGLDETQWAILREHVEIDMTANSAALILSGATVAKIDFQADGELVATYARLSN